MFRIHEKNNNNNNKKKQNEICTPGMKKIESAICTIFVLNVLWNICSESVSKQIEKFMYGGNLEILVKGFFQVNL